MPEMEHTPTDIHHVRVCTGLLRYPLLGQEARQLFPKMEYRWRAPCLVYKMFWAQENTQCRPPWPEENWPVQL